MSELKPCPFCGSRNVLKGIAYPIYMSKKFKGRYAFAGCKDCGASTILFYANNHTGSPLMNKAHEEIALEKAGEAWNRRVDDGYSD